MKMPPIALEVVLNKPVMLGQLAGIGMKKRSLNQNLLVIVVIVDAQGVNFLLIPRKK
jgi:hypothetical protein